MSKNYKATVPLTLSVAIRGNKKGTTYPAGTVFTAAELSHLTKLQLELLLTKKQLQEVEAETAKAPAAPKTPVKEG